MAPAQSKVDRVAANVLTIVWKRMLTASDANATNQIQARDGSGAATSSAASSSTLYLGVGLGVGGAFFLGLIVLAVLTVRRRREHKRILQDVDVEDALPMAQRQEVGEAPRPASGVMGCNFLPLNARAGWDALASEETINEPEPVARRGKSNRSSVSLPKGLRRKGLQLKKFNRLTAIVESPRSELANSPTLPVLEPLPSLMNVEVPARVYGAAGTFNSHQAKQDDTFERPGSPKPYVLPSFAIQPREKQGLGITNYEPHRTGRSKSMGAIPEVPNDERFGAPSRVVRAPYHARSISLGAPPTAPPKGPVPPIPNVKPWSPSQKGASRSGLLIQRMSSASRESTENSILVATPILMLPERKSSLGSPSVAEVVAEDDDASLKDGSGKQWSMPLPGKYGAGEAQPDGKENRSMAHTSIRSNIARFSVESAASNRPSSASSDDILDRFAVAHVGLGDDISISRVSSNSSQNGRSSGRKASTPKRVKRSSVSASGSPAERKKGAAGVLRDISGNSLGPSRQPSNATQHSNRSSVGNPFQWDQQPPLQKPSALKGSPNARKGHRRQNCVRISTLQPQVLGPPPSRSTSPSIMDGIEEEESVEGDDFQITVPKKRSGSNHILSRPPSASSFAPDLRLQPFRTSLTPDSPTLAWTSYRRPGLPKQPSDSQLSTITLDSSNGSSFGSVSRFPSPVRTTTTQISRAVPEFYLSRPSTDMEQDENAHVSPQLSPVVEVSSSPPVQNAGVFSYGSIQPSNVFSAAQSHQYDPTGLEWQSVDVDRSSVPLPFAAQSPQHGTVDDNAVTRSPAVSYGGDLPDTPPISPKDAAEEFQGLFDNGTEVVQPNETLTSANASAMLARMPGQVDFPGAPVLSPPLEDEVYASITPGSQRRSTEIIFVPEPLQIGSKSSTSTAPTGPRDQPPQSVLKNAMALRRMNSEVSSIVDRESRRYVNLTRESSLVLPWMDSPDLNEGAVDMNEMFDFDFASTADTRGGAEASGGMETGMLTLFDGRSEVERRLDGTLARVRTSLASNGGSHAIWEDGAATWTPTREIGVARGSPSVGEVTMRRQAPVAGRPESVQMTPRSFYDSDGFLRTGV